MRFFLIIIFNLPSLLFASENYQMHKRLEYIEKSLKAFTESKKETILKTEKFIDILNNTSCASSSESLKLDCFIEEAKKSCLDYTKKINRDRCKLYSDVLIANKMSERFFISRSEKYRILKNYKNVGEAMRSRLNQSYSEISSLYYLSDDYTCKDHSSFECHSQSMNDFCFNLGNKLSLSWHHFISSLVSFIGIHFKR